MGRELRRKQAKKDGKSLQRELPEQEHQVKKLIIITIILVIIVGLIYLLSALFLTHELDWFENKSETVNKLPDKTILASEIFSQKEEEYYVYFYDYNKEDETIASVISSRTDLTIYRVNTADGLNNKYISEESNKNAKNLSELKVKASTVIKVTGEKITGYYENQEIENTLKK